MRVHLLKKLYFISFILLFFARNAYSQARVDKGIPFTASTCTPDSQIFSYSGSNQSFVVPCGVFSITVKAWGGGGGGGGTDGSGTPATGGGGGAYASSTLPVNPGTNLTVIVGGGGQGGSGCQTGTGGGAGGFGLGPGGNGANPGSSGCSGPGGGGGGGTGIENGATILIVAGGGGGAGGGETGSTFAGSGGGGGTNGSPGNSSTDGTIMASSTTAGLSATMPSTDNPGAGGGGGGLQGGGAGATVPGAKNTSGGAGGAGGTSMGTTVVNGAVITPGNSTDPDLCASCATGGGVSASGGNGYLIIFYCNPPPLTLTSSSTNPTCAGNNGTAVANVSGGTRPYTYSWSNGQTTSSVNNLSIGSYTVVVKDSGGCKDSATFTLTGFPPVYDSIASYTNVSVACGANGTATVGVRGGTTPYSYSWSDGQTVSNATNLPAGSYTVTVTDANNCTATTNVSITQPGALTASVPSTTAVSCYGGSNGTAVGGVTGGNAPYTFSWSNGQTTDTAKGLAAGSYTVSVTDANGCTVSATTVISQPAAIRDSIASVTAALCHGDSNGTATNGTKGGTSPYSYLWNNGQTSGTATGLAAGTYSVTVTDSKGCKDSTTATITQPTVLSLTAAAFNATCNNSCNGSATVIPKGGTNPYSYLWSNGTTTANVNNLCAGTYSVVVKDANGCVHDTNPLTVNQPPPIVLTKTSSNSFCGQADGSASVTISGGTPGYAYQWSNGATTTSINNVRPGTYCFGVEDANKCLDSICVIVGNTPGETANISSVVNVSCNGGNNGSAVGGATGGVQPYSYAWSNGQSTSNATGLTAGTYTLTVTDSSGCQSTATATVTQPALVTATTNSPATICIGQSASISASASGGTPPYAYAWNTGCNSSSCSVSPAATTTYTLNVTDANSCTAAPVTVTVTVNPPLSVNTGLPKATCPGGSVNVNASASGGDGSYTYVWTPGNVNGQSVSVTPPSSMYYTVTVNDGCGTPPAKDSVLVIVDPLPVIAFSADTLSGCYPVCVSFTDNSTIASGGIQSWMWNFGNGSSSPSQNPTQCYDSAGSYSVSLTATSDSGCSASFTHSNMITVFAHPHAIFSYAPQPVSIVSPTVYFSDQSTDLYGIAQWAWNFGDSLNLKDTNYSSKQNPYHTFADTGTFCVKLGVMNIHGCTDSITECLVVNPVFTLYIPSAFTPDGDGLNDVFQPKGSYISSFEMYIFDRWGSHIFHTNDIYKGWNGAVNNGSNLCQQDTYVYLIYVKDYHGVDHTYMGKVTLLK